jgi:hypothetical protein
MMLRNQTKFEIARDICRLTGVMFREETIHITIKKVHGVAPNELYDWESSIGEFHGGAEASAAIRKAYMENC